MSFELEGYVFELKNQLLEVSKDGVVLCRCPRFHSGAGTLSFTERQLTFINDITQYSDVSRVLNEHWLTIQLGLIPCNTEDLEAEIAATEAALTAAQDEFDAFMATRKPIAERRERHPLLLSYHGPFPVFEYMKIEGADVVFSRSSFDTDDWVLHVVLAGRDRPGTCAFVYIKDGAVRKIWIQSQEAAPVVDYILENMDLINEVIEIEDHNNNVWGAEEYKKSKYRSVERLFEQLTRLRKVQGEMVRCQDKK